MILLYNENYMNKILIFTKNQIFMNMKRIELKLKLTLFLKYYNA